MTIQNYISQLSKNNPDAIMVSSLGNINNAFKELDHPHKVYMRGAMGHSIGCGLGIALSTDKKVIVVLGEGSFLMKLGSLASVLHHNPKNLEIHVLDNGCYNSCGGQKNYFDSIKHLIPFNIEEIE